MSPPSGVLPSLSLSLLTRGRRSTLAPTAGALLTRKKPLQRGRPCPSWRGGGDRGHPAGPQNVPSSPPGGDTVWRPSHPRAQPWWHQGALSQLPAGGEGAPRPRR